MTREEMFTITTDAYLDDAERKAVESDEAGREQEHEWAVERYWDSKSQIDKTRAGFKALVDGVNGSQDVTLRAMFTEFINSHRTLQAYMVETLTKLLALIGDLPEEMIDPRNDGAVVVARELTEGCEYVPDPKDIMKRLSK